MGTHAEYGKSVLRTATNGAFRDSGRTTEIHLGLGKARIDGTINGKIAVEIESRVPKQIRGAILDLILHPYPKKLLVLEPVHMGDVASTAKQCEFILARFLSPENFRVVVVHGSGFAKCLEVDAETVKFAVDELEAKRGPNDS